MLEQSYKHLYVYKHIRLVVCCTKRSHIFLQMTVLPDSRQIWYWHENILWHAPINFFLCIFFKTLKWPIYSMSDVCARKGTTSLLFELHWKISTFYNNFVPLFFLWRWKQNLLFCCCLKFVKVNHLKPCLKLLYGPKIPFKELQKWGKTES